MSEYVTAQRVVRVYEEARTFEQRREPTKWAAHRGRLFLGYFLLAKQMKVTSCRATPDGVGLTDISSQDPCRQRSSMGDLQGNAMMRRINRQSTRIVPEDRRTYRLAGMQGIDTSRLD